MQLEIDGEYQRFLCEIKRGGFEVGCYMDETEYEDEYPHDSIGKAAQILKEKIADYLRENQKGGFIVYSDWCVHVMSNDYAEKIGVREKVIKYCTV